MYNYHLNPKPLTNNVIILDLDETLVHSFNEGGALNKWRDLQLLDKLNMDLRDRLYMLNVETRRDPPVNIWGIKRPHIDEFLDFLFNYASLVVVHTAGIYEYGHAVVENLFVNHPEPGLILTRSDCQRVGDNYEKPIHKILNDYPELRNYINPNLDNVLIIDDRSTSFRQNPNNGILIPTYEPKMTVESLSADDLALPQIMNWLNRPEVINCKDVRVLDKSHIFNDYQPVSMKTGRTIQQKLGNPPSKVSVRS